MYTDNKHECEFFFRHKLLKLYGLKNVRAQPVIQTIYHEDYCIVPGLECVYGWANLTRPTSAF